MNIRLTLRDAAGKVILTKEVSYRTLASLGGATGQAAWALYGEAYHAGHSPIGTTLTVEEYEPDTAAVVARARAIQSRKRP